MNTAPSTKYKILATYATEQEFTANEDMLLRIHDYKVVVDHDVTIIPRGYIDDGVYDHQLNVVISAETEDEEMIFDVDMIVHVITKVDTNLSEKEIEGLICAKTSQTIWSKIISIAQNMLSAGGFDPQLVANLVFVPNRNNLYK